MGDPKPGPCLQGLKYWNLGLAEEEKDQFLTLFPDLGTDFSRSFEQHLGTNVEVVRVMSDIMWRGRLAGGRPK